MLSEIRQYMRTASAGVELANVTLLFVWAVVLLTPPPTFESSISYDAMGAWMAEWTWALLATMIGIVGFAGIRWVLPAARNVGLLGGLFFWLTVGLSIVFSNIGSTGGWVYLAISILCATAYAAGRR